MRPFLFLFAELVGNVRKQSYLTCTLDGGVELALMLSASTRDSSGKNLAALADELSQLSCILIINIGNLIGTEDTYFLSLTYGTNRTARIFCSIHLMKTSLKYK